MNDSELEELIKKDLPVIPDVKWNSKELLKVSKEKEKKNKKNISRVIYSLSFISIMFVIIFSIIMVNQNNNIIKMNTSINNLETINSNEDRIMEVMKLDREIKANYQNSLSKISIDKLKQVTNNTVKQLKATFEWKSTLSPDEDYKELCEYFRFDNVYDIKMVRSFSSIVEIIDSQYIIGELLSYFDLPFIEIVNNKDSFYEDYKEKLSGDYKDFYSVSLKYNGMDENESIIIDIYGSGYITVVINERIGDGTYDVINKYSLVSLVPIYFDGFSEFVSYENLNRILGE